MRRSFAFPVELFSLCQSYSSILDNLNNPTKSNSVTDPIERYQTLTGGAVNLKAHRRKRNGQFRAVNSRLISERLDKLERRTRALWFGFFALCGLLLYVSIRVLVILLSFK
jgi:hypothetical protein